MDENMRYGKTDACTTFNNPPLCKSGDFEIRVLEVYVPLEYTFSDFHHSNLDFPFNFTDMDLLALKVDDKINVQLSGKMLGKCPFIWLN